MIDKQRDKLLMEIDQTRQAIARSKSEKGKRDRTKHLNYLLKELRDYDRFMAGSKKASGRS